MSVPSWCRVGARVVCVDDSNFQPHCAPLKVGAVYTIAAITTAPSGRSGLVIAEVNNPIGPFGNPYGYNIPRFRPAVEDSDENGIEAQFYHKRGLKSKAPVRESERA